jgi:predicted alpha/beta hydrolase
LAIAATDGVDLAATVFRPARESNGRSLIINSATGVRRGYYGPFAAFLAGHGFRVITYDYRGVGDSPTPGGPFAVRMRHWGERDIAAVIEWAETEWPDDRLLVVAHSGGGQLVGLAENNGKIGAMLAIAAPSGYWGHWPGPYRYALALLWHVGIPLPARVLGVFPGRLLGLGVNLPAGVALEWAAWCRDPLYLFGRRRPSTTSRFLNFRAPLRAYAFTDDIHAPPIAAKALLDFYPNAQKEYLEITPAQVGVSRIVHWAFFRESFRHIFWEESVRWLLAA